MPRDASRDPYATSSGGLTTTARDWYALLSSHVGAQELPIYGRAMRVRVGASASPPVTLVVVPSAENEDANTQQIIIDATEFLPFAVRRIVSINGGTSIPTGVEIQIVTR